MKLFVNSFLIICFVCIFFSCSTQKNKFLNKRYHATTSKYNILFNGSVYFEKGIQSIQEKYEDNYWELLPLEPIVFEEKKTTSKDLRLGAGFKDDSDEEKPKSPFEKAEEKTVKTIQKHGMKIRGKERNNQIDDAYFLLGKSRYYSQRFIPAIEAFNYVIANYPDASLINETKIWRAKANLRIDNEEFAIESLKLLLKTDGIDVIPDNIQEQAYTGLAMAYIQLDSISQAIASLKKATKTFNNKDQSARNLFVLGQLYSFKNQKDSAQQVFRKLIEFKKAPYKYRVHAHIEVAKNNPKDSSSVTLINQLQKMIKNRDNRPYLDKLYYQIGELEEQNDSLHKAVFNYHKSLKSPNGSYQQKTYTYEKLGNIQFDATHYVDAGAYYDSVLQAAKKTNDTLSLRIRRVKRKFKGLASLIDYEKIVKTNDSIIRIAAMPKETQNSFFENYITNLKEQDKVALEKAAIQQAASNAFSGNSFKGKWYFYNPQSIEFGKKEFQKTWTNRALKDNWRWASESTNPISKQDGQIASKSSIPEKYKVQTYIDKIPTNVSIIDRLKIERTNALFELGLIYKEQFKNPVKAISYLKRTIALTSKERLQLGSYFYLYEIYTDLEDSENALKYKNILLLKYPKSNYAHIIQFPEKQLLTEKKLATSEILYEEFYRLYKNKKYDELRYQFDKNLPIIENSILISKFELLKAYAIGKYKTPKAFRLAMEYVAFVYAETAAGKEAEQIITRLKQ